MACSGRRVADIIGPVAKIRIDFVATDREQVFISDPNDVAAVLTAIQTDQNTSRWGSPPNDTFALNLNFFDAKGTPHAVLGFYGGTGDKNRLQSLGFSLVDEGSVTIADPAGLQKFIDRYSAQQKPASPGASPP